MILPQGVIPDFESVTRYPLSRYFARYIAFMNDHRRKIIEYYSGAANKASEISFNELAYLLKETGHLSDLIDIHHNRLISGAFWELIEILSIISTTLETIDNSSRWLRSAITKNNFNPNAESLYVIQKLQTLEKISSTILGSFNQETDWVRLAMRNDLREEDYTPNGGNSIYISTQGKYTIKLLSVVDNITEEKVYGLDLDRKITFEDDDLKSLSYKQTFNQTVEILCRLKQGTTPEFPGEGIQGSLINGSNIASLPYSILFRQLQYTFKQDDTIRSMTVTNIKHVDDALYIEMDIESRLGEIQKQLINTSTL